MADPALAHPVRTCIRCGGIWPQQIFFRYFRRERSPGWGNTCIGCESRDRAKREAQQFLRRKAVRAIHGHAAKYGFPIKDFCEKFGWNVETMITDLAALVDGACWYCQVPYREMGDGRVGQMTFDVVNPQVSPHYRTNVRICCYSCNSRKKTMSPERWSECLAVWARYKAWINRVEHDPISDLPLFQLKVFSNAEKTN